MVELSGYRYQFRYRDNIYRDTRYCCDMRDDDQGGCEKGGVDLQGGREVGGAVVTRTEVRGEGETCTAGGRWAAPR